MRAVKVTCFLPSFQSKISIIKPVNGPTSQRIRKFATSPTPQKVRVMVSDTTDPLFNLATEDWIFKHADLDKQTLFLWRNAPTVVIGRNQNPWKECHLQRMEEEGVTLARRSSGGGAVYQDLGNTNFTYLSSMTHHDKKVNTQIICDALAKNFNVKAEASGRNDIVVNGQKISGSAYKYTGQRALHHGTLLINVDMDALQKYLNVNKAKLKSKGVDSVKSRVVNLHTLNAAITHDSLCNALIKEFFSYYGNTCEIEQLNRDELNKQPLLRETYEQLKDWNWRFGETPAFEHNLETRFDWGIMDIYINSIDGKITEVKVFSDTLYPVLCDELKTVLEGATYDKPGFTQALQNLKTRLENSAQPEIAPFADDIRKWIVEAI